MTDDLKERLRHLCNGHPNATIPWPHRAIHDALAYITDLEARLAAAETEIIRLEQEALRLREELLEQRGAKAEAAAMMPEAELVADDWLDMPAVGREFTATHAPVVPAEGLDALIEAAKAEAEKAMSKFPQPNYVISKVADEAGEVVKAAIHCAEGRETQENVVSEIRQAMAMLFRLYLEGDQVHGLPPLRAQQPAPPGSGVTVQEAGWRPIETAPKNGAFILAIASMTGHRGYSIICWDDDGWIICWDDDGWGGYTADDERRLVKFPPAYWMPLPEPPAHESPQ